VRSVRSFGYSAWSIALVAILGFVAGDTPLLGMIANNQADAILHVLIAVVTLWIGFAMKPEEPVAA
jgi:hypothetical protein